MGIITDILDKIGIGSGEAAPPINPDDMAKAFGGEPDEVNAPPDPRTIKILKGAGMDDDRIGVFLTLPEPQQARILTKIISPGVKPKAVEDKGDPAGWLKRNAPGVDIEGLPPSVLSNMASQEFARRQRAAGETPKAGARVLDRSKIDYGRFPGLEGAADTMTDADISQFISEHLGDSAGGDGAGQYEDVKGAPKLKIVQDAAFERSGLKSGDTVCIRIP